MVDKHLVLGVGSITCVHDEAGQVTNAVDPEGIAMKVARRGLELDQSSSLMLITIKDDFLDRLVVVIILHKSTEQLVHHTAFHAMGLARLSALLQVLNAPLDQVYLALPILLCRIDVEELDGAGCMVKDLLPLGSHRPDLNLGTLLSPLRCGRNSEKLLATLRNKRLRD